MGADDLSILLPFRPGGSPFRFVVAFARARARRARPRARRAPGRRCRARRPRAPPSRQPSRPVGSRRTARPIRPPSGPRPLLRTGRPFGAPRDEAPSSPERRALRVAARAAFFAGGLSGRLARRLPCRLCGRSPSSSPAGFRAAFFEAFLAAFFFLTTIRPSSSPASAGSRIIQSGCCRAVKPARVAIHPRAGGLSVAIPALAGDRGWRWRMARDGPRGGRPRPSSARCGSAGPGRRRFGAGTSATSRCRS